MYSRPVCALVSAALALCAGCAHPSGPPVASVQPTPARAAAAAAPHSDAAACKPSPAVNRGIVLRFYDLALVGLKPAEAFSRYVAPDFVEHKPDVARGDRAGTVAYLEELIASVPQPRWEVLRTIAEGDLVFVHARFTPAPGAHAYAIADVFRLRDCTIVEHWDVVAGPPREQRNPRPWF